MTPARRRLSPAASRQNALDAAKALLIESGPQAVTLKAVAARVGRTHANLLHHFGSAHELQLALVEQLSNDICDRIAEEVRRDRAGEGDRGIVVDLAFDAFDHQGAAGLAMWMLMTGNEDVLDPIVTAIRRLIDDVGPDERGDTTALSEETLTLVLMAFGDAMIGEALGGALTLKRDAARQIAKRMFTRE